MTISAIDLKEKEVEETTAQFFPSCTPCHPTGQAGAYCPGRTPGGMRRPGEISIRGKDTGELSRAERMLPGSAPFHRDTDDFKPVLIQSECKIDTFMHD